MRIGIIGGTFDPVHLGHLYLAKKVLRKLSLEKIIFIPAYISPHKKNIKATAAIHRYRMLKLAIIDRQGFVSSGIELRRKGRSYSVETLRQIRKRYGFSATIFFITGSDSLKDIDKWRSLKEILRLSKFVIAKRPSFAIKHAPQEFIVLDIGAKDISSSRIRDRVKKGLSIDTMVPEKVRDYIHAHRLYR